MAEIALEHVGKRFPDGTEAVHDAHLTIGDGEFFILVGPSGCGKSTLLNMIAGLEDLSTGVLRVDGRVMNDVDPRDRDMAMVFQSYALYPHMSVRGNLAFPLELAKLPAAEIAERVARAAEVLGIGDLLDRRPASLSGGQRQRVAMGRAIVRRPRAFLLDEPLSNLDASLRVQMRAEIARLHRHLATTTVYVTHDQTEAMTLADRLAVLRAGRVHQVGTPREVYTAPANLFVAGFIGSPAMNFLPARREGARLVLPVGVVEPEPSTLDALPDGPLVAGIRPEHIHEAPPGDPRAPDGGLEFEVNVDVVEWLGPELYVHFEVETSGPVPEVIARDTPQASSGTRLRLTARLDPASRAAAGGTLRLRLESGDLALFDARTGANAYPRGRA